MTDTSKVVRLPFVLLKQFLQDISNRAAVNRKVENFNIFAMPRLLLYSLHQSGL